MASDRVWYWVAVGVLAFGVSNSFINKGAGCFRSFVQQSLALSNHAHGQMFLSNDADFTHAQVAVARAQARIAAAQTRAALQQADIIRLQNQKVRVTVAGSIPRPVVVCPRQSFKVAIPEPPLVMSDNGTI